MQQHNLTITPIATESEGVHPQMRRRGWTVAHRREVIAGYLFVSPVVLGILLFTLVPLVSALYYSFTDYNLLSPANWIGLANYHHLWLDPLWYKSLLVTLILPWSRCQWG